MSSQAPIHHGLESDTHTIVERHRNHQKKMDQRQARTKQAPPAAPIPAAVAAQNVTPPPPAFKPRFQWDTAKHGVHIVPKLSHASARSDMPASATSDHLLSVFGYTLNIGAQVDTFKKKLQTFYIESKSHNPLIGKFSELKFGFMAAVLSILDVAPEDIDTLKQEAIANAVTDNVDCFTQNEYNVELLTIFSNSKQDSGRMKILTELRNQLIKQMGHYGYNDYYTKDKVYQIKLSQIQKIQSDLLDEQQNLSYVRQFQ